MVPCRGVHRTVACAPVGPFLPDVDSFPRRFVSFVSPEKPNNSSAISEMGRAGRDQRKSFAQVKRVWPPKCDRADNLRS
jgi:hypothetical protein